MKTVARFPIVLRIALFGLALSATAAVHADVTFSVNTIDDTADGGCLTSTDACSLRAAIMQANHLSGPGVVTIEVPAGTYTLTLPPLGEFAEDDGEDKGDLNLVASSHSVSIHGAGAANTIIDGNQLDGVMTIGAGSVANIGGVTIRNGFRQFGDYVGAGGGVANFGTLTITDCVIESNHGANYGGGIFSASGSVLKVARSSIRSNVADNQGGGMNVFGRTIVHDTTFSSNSAFAGAGIFNYSSSGADYLYIVNSTLSGNEAVADGGGIYNSVGTTFLYNTTVVHNKANSLLLGDFIGGGIYAEIGSRFGVVNTLMATNSAGFDTNNDCIGALEAYGVNLVGDPTAAGCTTINANLTAISLGTIDPFLQDNGGPTMTDALLAGSEAIDSTLDALGCVDENGAPLTTDQRGAPRIAGARCDVGAFEFGSVVPVENLVFRDGFDGGM